MGQGRGQNDHGASAVEFAIVLPILMLLVFAIIEFGLAFNRMQVFQAAAREGARLAAVGVDGEDVEELTLEILESAAAPQDVDFQLASCADGAEYGRVTVSLVAAARESYGIAIPAISFGVFASPDYETTAAFRCERAPESAP